MHLVRTDLTGNSHKRCAVAVGIGNSGYQIGCSRSEGRHANAGFAGEPAVNIRHESGALFVTYCYKLNFRVFQRVHNGQIFFAGNPENIMNSFFFQTFDQEVRSIALLFLFCHLKRSFTVLL